MASKTTEHRSDKLGMISALLCIVHCTLLPVVFALTTSLDDPFVGYSPFVDILFVVVSVASVYFSSRHSDSILIKVALWFFFGIFIIGIGIESIVTYGKTIALLGSVGLIVSHFFNLRHCRRTHAYSFNTSKASQV